MACPAQGLIIIAATYVLSPFRAIPYTAGVTGPKASFTLVRVPPALVWYGAGGGGQGATRSCSLAGP